jgi:multimeric flavodoxin WrbA
MDGTIALFSSARRHGNTGQLIDRVAETGNIEVIDLGEKDIAPYDYEHRNRADDFEPLMEKLLGYRQIVFASPVYWYSCTPQMKAFLDRITDYLDLPDLLEKGRALRGKVGYVVCTSVYDEAAPAYLDMFRSTLDYLGMTFGGYLHVNCEAGYVARDHEDEIQDFLALLARGEKRD